eukprot:166334-Hanusia_phi.AAC.2
MVAEPERRGRGRLGLLLGKSRWQARAVLSDYRDQRLTAMRELPGGARPGRASAQCLLRSPPDRRTVSESLGHSASAC